MGFERLACQFIRSNDEHAVRLRIRNVDYPKIASLACLAESNP